jgi:hypothetical protein
MQVYKAVLIPSFLDPLYSIVIFEAAELEDAKFQMANTKTVHVPHLGGIDVGLVSLFAP